MDLSKKIVSIGEFDCEKMNNNEEEMVVGGLRFFADSIRRQERLSGWRAKVSLILYKNLNKNCLLKC